MMFRHVLALSLILAALCSCGRGSSGKHPKDFASLGTGPLTGVYFPVGGEICRLAGKGGAIPLRLVVEPTDGSVANLDAIAAGEMEFGLAQADCLEQAYAGSGIWASSGPRRGLRAVFALYPETVALLAAPGSGVADVMALRGKRVGLGAKGSGNLLNSTAIMEACGLSGKELSASHGQPKDELGQLLAGRLDAFFVTCGHPNPLVQEALSKGCRLVPIRGPGIKRLLESLPRYVAASIPAKAYPGAEDVESIGMLATLATSERVDAALVRAVAKAVFENFDEFTATHPALGSLRKEDLLRQLPVPFHPGVHDYCREAGLPVPAR